MNKLNCIAITGGIGSGKSTVLDLFKISGYQVLSADVIAQSIMKNTSDFYKPYTKIIDDWLKTDFSSKSEIDRAELRTLLNNIPDSYQTIAGLAKPFIQQAIEQEYNKLKLITDNIVIEVPLLVENGSTSDFETIIAVTANLETRIARIKKRDPHLSDKEIEHRINIQSTDQEKLAVCDFSIDNSGTYEELAQAFNSLLINIKQSEKSMNVKLTKF